jgi:hypothetical protein
MAITIVVTLRTPTEQRDLINGNAAFAEQFLRPRYESPTARTSARQH